MKVGSILHRVSLPINQPSTEDSLMKEMTIMEGSVIWERGGRGTHDVFTEIRVWESHDCLERVWA
jgi:hypothetical protein